MEDNKRKLYDALSQDYDLGSFEQFSSDIADETKRRKLFDATSEEYDFGDYETFSKQLGFGGSKAEQPAPKEPEPPVSESAAPAPAEPASSQPSQHSGTAEPNFEWQRLKRFVNNRIEARKDLTIKGGLSSFMQERGITATPHEAVEEKRGVPGVKSEMEQPEVSRYDDAPQKTKDYLEGKTDAVKYAAGRQDDQQQYLNPTDDEIIANAYEGKGYSIESAISTGKTYEGLSKVGEAIEEESKQFKAKYADLEELLSKAKDGVLKFKTQAEIDKFNKEYAQYKADYERLSNGEKELESTIEAVMASPAGREYKALMQRYDALKQAEDTPENRLELAKVSAVLARNPIARVEMGENAPGVSQMDFELNRAEADYVNAKLEESGHDRAQRKEWRARRSELNKEALDNEWYQADVARRIEETDKEMEGVFARMQEIKNEALKNKSVMAVPEDFESELRADPEYKRLLLASNELSQKKRRLEHIRDKNTSGFWVNFMDVFADANTYTSGLTGLETKLGGIVDYYNQGNPGSDELLSAIAGSNSVKSEEGSFVEGKGKYGAIAAQSIPFMVQIALTGGMSGVADVVGGATKKLFGKLADKFLVKAVGAVAGDIAAGVVAANTIGAPKTATDFMDNYYGQLVKDENGNVSLEGGSGKAGQALRKAEVSNTMEFASERFGDHLQKLLGRGVLRYGIDAARKGGKKAVNPAIEQLAKTLGVEMKDFGLRSATDINANWAMKALAKFTDISNKVGIQGLPFECIEEYVGLFGNILLGGEEDWMDFSKFGDIETHTDIWGGMLYSIGLTQASMGTVGAVGAGVNAIKNAREYKMLESELVSQADSMKELLGEEDASMVKSVIDGATNQELPSKIVEFMQMKQFDNMQKQAILDYIKTTYIYRGFNAGTIAQARERITNADELGYLNINAELSTAGEQMADAYMLGYNSSTSTRDEIASAVETGVVTSKREEESLLDAVEKKEELDKAIGRQKQRVSEVTGISDMTEETANNLLADESQTQEVREAVLDYLMAISAEKGFADAQKEKQMRQKNAMRTYLEKQYGGKFYYTSPFGDNVVATTMRLNPETNEPEPIYILSYEPNADGKVPFMSPSGEKGFISNSEVFGLGENGSVQPGLVEEVTLDEYMDAYYADYQARKEAELAQRDAELQAQREAAEAERKAKEEAEKESEDERQARKKKEVIERGISSHTDLESGLFNYKGVWGSLTNKDDQGATFVPEDDSLPSERHTWEDLAQTEETPQPKPVPEPQPEPVPEESETGIELDENGEPIYDAPGVTPLQAYDDIYSKLSEKNADKFVIAKSDAANKALSEAQKLVAEGDAEKAAIDDWDMNDGEGLNAFAKRQAEAKAKVDERIADAQAQLPELQRKADFWNELRAVAEENTDARKKEEARKALIEKYGVDVSQFDLTPSTAEEAVAEYLGNATSALINLDDAIRETLGRSKTGKVPAELFRHLGKYGILSKSAKSSLRAVAGDIVAHYEDLGLDEDEVIDTMIDFLLRYTKKELQEYIFNQRLDDAIKQKEYYEEAPEDVQQNGTSADESGKEEKPAEEPEAPEKEPEVKEPESPAQEPEKGKEEGGKKSKEKSGESGGKSVSSQEEGETSEEGSKEGEQGKSEGESTYGSSNTVVTKARYEELRKKMLEKIKGQMNAGFDPEIFAMGVEMAAYHIEAGARKFVDFAKRMIADLTDAIRPYLKGIYNGARDLPGMEEYKSEMDSAADVEKIDVNADFNTLSDEQESSDSVRSDDGHDSETVPDSTGGGVEGKEGDSNVPTDTGTSGEDSEGSGDAVDAGEDSGGGEEWGPESAGEDSSSEDGAVAERDKVAGRGKDDGTRGGKRHGGKTNDGRRGGRGSGRAGSESTGGTESVEKEEPKDSEKKDPNESREEAKAEKEKSVKEETDTNKLEEEKDALKEELSNLEQTDENAEERARIAGELDAVIARLRELYEKAPSKLEELAQEKVPYVSVSDPSGEHAIGSVVPSGVADAMYQAMRRIENEIGKPLAEFVREELQYKSLDEMFSKGDEKDTGLAAEQVDAVALAIYQMKKGRSFINGDMTGIGKGRVGAALIRWAILHGKKCIFATDKPGLFTDMYRDLCDIGSGGDDGVLPFIINDKDPGNENKSTVIVNREKKPVIKTPTPAEKHKLWESDGSSLPIVERKPVGIDSGPQKKGKKYDLVMMTYSQAQSQRGTWSAKKLAWLKSYAKDAIIICDESHLAAGDSERGSYFQDLVKVCGGVTFMSATFAKNPECMKLYALRSSMGDARMSNQALIETISNYGIPMKEFLAQTLIAAGEMVRRERDFTGVTTEWCDPKELYSENEYKLARETNDKTVELIRAIIGFQRSFIEPIIAGMNKNVASMNEEAKIKGEGWFYSYTTTPYSSQVSNLCNLMFYAMKAKKAADLAIEKIKKGEKAIIVVDNTLEGYIKAIEGIIDSPDFSAVFEKGAKNILKYRFNKRWKKLDMAESEEQGKEVWIEDEDKAEITEYDSIAGEFGEVEIAAYQLLLQRIKDYAADDTKMRLTISPIDYIKELIADAGYSCGEITGRSVQLVRREDGTYEKVKRPDERNDAEYRFNGGTREHPLPPEEQFDAVIINSAGATGRSLHASRRFGNQSKRNMIIVQAAKDPNVEVQTRGRNDRTGQVLRGAYYYITSPIPAEYKTTMMLRKKLASLDAQTSGTENVSSNRVDADDMDNMYGDEVAKDFLAEHPEINVQLDKPIVQQKDRMTGQMIWKGRDGLLYDLLIGMQRMTCEEQELILKSLQEQYIELVEYYEQNGTNELSTTTLNLEAETIDEGVFVHGKDNSSISGFAHDTKLERVRANVLKKPLRSEQIYDQMRKLKVLDSEGKIDPRYGDRISLAAQEYASKKKAELAEKQEAELNELIKTLKESTPHTEEMTESDFIDSIMKSEAVLSLKAKQQDEAKTFGDNLDLQVARVDSATSKLKPGAIMMIPMIDGDPNSVPYGPGRFIGFKIGKDGNPKSVKAMFATRDSRSSIDIPVVKMRDVIIGIERNTVNSGNLFSESLRDIGGDYWDTSISDEDRRAARDEWWDKRVSKIGGRSIRYIITGNLFQAGFNLGTQKSEDKRGKEKETEVRGKMCLFTRRDPETGRITVEQGMLLVDTFDPESFYVADIVTKPDVWDTGKSIFDDKSRISTAREGDVLVVRFFKRKNEKMANHPAFKDETILSLMNSDKFVRTKEYIECYIPEGKVEEALQHLYKEYGYTKDRLFVMPDSTERVDAIVPDPRPYNEILEELKAKYPYYNYRFQVDDKIKELIARHKADLENEDVIKQIKDFVALRQAMIRKEYASKDTSRLAWLALAKEEIFEKETDKKDERDAAYAELMAIKAEIESRIGDLKNAGTLKHYKQGRHKLEEVVAIFKEFNKDKFNKEIAEKVFKIFKGIKEANIPIVFNEKIDNGTGGFSQGQLVEYNWKFFNSDWIPDEEKAHTVLHELIHTLTVYAERAVSNGYSYLLDDEIRNVVQELETIFSKIRFNDAFKHDEYRDYGTTDWAEMLAEAGSNPVFREDLKKVKLIKTVRDGDVSFSVASPGQDLTGKKVVTAYDAVMDRLNALLDGFSETALMEVFRGTRQGEMRYRRSDTLRTPIARARAISSIYELAKSLGVKFKEDGTIDGKGLFDPKTGQIRINVNAHRDTADLQATLLHEAVAHYGLRKLLGKDFAEAMDEIYAGASKGVQKHIDALAEKYGLSRSVATEEYLAELAEDGRFTPEDETIWQRMWYWLQTQLRKLGLMTKLTDADMRALLYASFRNLQTRGAVAQAHHVTVMNALRQQAALSHEEEYNDPEDDGPSGGTFTTDEFGEGINDLPEEVKQLAIEQETKELYRRSRAGAVAGTAAQMYNFGTSTVWNALYEVTVDELAPVDKLTDALVKESGKELSDSERVSDAFRETGGKAMYHIREYVHKFMEPMWSAVGQFRKNAGISIGETERYIGLKSGLERNVVLAKRDARKDYEREYNAVVGEANAEIRKINIREKKAIEKLEKQLDEGKISDVTFINESNRVRLQSEADRKAQQDLIDAAKGVFDAHVAEIDAGTDARYLEYRKKDYSAITTWAGTTDLEAAEKLAQDYVDDMEKRAGKDTTDELWKRINAATKETLKFQYEHDMLTRAQYNDVAKMMKYYVPMRGFEDDTAEDLYNYYVTSQSNAFQATLQSAKGRKTLYEGPLGYIGAMHSSAISQGVKNQAKLSLLTAVRNRPKNSIATVTRAWFVNTNQRDPATGRYIFEPAYPPIPEGADFATRQAIIEQFEEEMHEKYMHGDAYNSHREVDLHGGVVAFEKESHKNEHIVKVREGGREYGIIINGNPSAAQAINGVKRGNGVGQKALDVLRGWTRFLSQMFTTFSVPFWVSNFQRDHGQGLTNAFIRNKFDYLGRYILNRYKAFKIFPMIVGKEGLEKALAKGDPVAVLYKQYLENGGPMGQSRLEDNEYFEKQMKRYLDNSAKAGVIKGAADVLDVIGGVGEAIETITRFAVFMTSMESGRSVHESISDAKEISTNFARKGSGRAFTESELDRMVHKDGTKLSKVEKRFVNAVAIGVELCRATIPFFNAAVQGLENKITNYREHTAKTLIADSIYLMLGLAMHLVFGNAGGDDDKQKYSHTSDYLRRNNILNPLGNGMYLKWALPQEYRVMYALGDIIASAMLQERPVDDLAADTFGAFMQLLPMGAVTDEVVFNSADKQKEVETFLINVAPGTLAPVLEAVFNQDFKGSRLYNEGFNGNLRAYPGWTKALPTTGKEYVALSKFLNSATGGNDVERGWIDKVPVANWVLTNPAITEHLVESYFSGPYQLVVRLPEAAVKTVKGEGKVRDWPLVNRLLLNTNDNQRDAYYSNMYYYFKVRNTEAERIDSEYNNRKKEGKVEEFYKSDDYEYMKVFNKYDKKEKALRKISKKAEQDGDTAKKEAADNQIQEIHEKIAKECLDIYFDRQQVK